MHTKYCAIKIEHEIFPKQMEKLRESCLCVLREVFCVLSYDATILWPKFKPTHCGAPWMRENNPHLTRERGHF